MTEAAARQALAGTRFADISWRDVVASTNDEVMARAVEGAPEGTVVVADHQTAGRGRAGRSWVAPPGSSLLVSVLLRPSLPVDLLPLTTLALALAAGDACADVAGFRPLLKWPNDLVVGAAGNQRKLGGILAEVRVSTASRRHRPADEHSPVVLGIGLNVAWDAAPPEIAGMAATVSEVARRPVDRTQLVVALLRRFDELYKQLDRTDGRQQVLEEYRRRCTTLGRSVVVELTGRTLEGRAVDVDPKGHLVIQDSGGTQHTVRAGDVTHVVTAAG